MKEYKQFGIISDASLNVFNRLIGDDFTKGDIEDILKATEKVIEDIKYVLDLYGNGDLVLKAADSENMRNLIKEEQNIIKKIKAKL
jgi:hypothetical protein